MMLSDGAAYFLVVEICAWSVSACADSVAICDVERAKNRLVLICMGLAHVEDRLEDFARDLDHAARGLIGLLVAHEIDRFGIEIDTRHLIARGDRAVMDRGLRRSEEHTSELQSLMRISYAVFCLKKQNKI